MKNTIKGLLVVLIIIGLSSCNPQEEAMKDLGNIVNTSDIKVTVTVPDAQKPNDFHFTLATPECVGVFSCPDVGINYTGLEFNQHVAWAGTYNLSVQVYNKAGLSEIATIPFTVASTDPTICEDQTLRFLTGGCDQPNGKKWRIRTDMNGAIGCGDESSTSNNWWSPSSAELKPELTDDDMTFILNSKQQFVLANKGASFMNESTASLFPDGDPSGSFVTTHYTPDPNANWAITTEGGSKWLTLTKGFPAYAATLASVPKGKYKIIELTETNMHIVLIPGGIAWHYFLTSNPR